MHWYWGTERGEGRRENRREREGKERRREGGRVRMKMGDSIMVKRSVRKSEGDEIVRKDIKKTTFHILTALDDYCKNTQHEVFRILLPEWHASS